MPTLYSSGFDPPYDSPIEEDMAWHLVKHLSDDAVLSKQDDVVTPYGTFRLDLVAKTKAGLKIVFECDGKEYHTDQLRDRCRDALILSRREHAAIYRFRGQDLWYRPNDCLYIVAHNDPALFSLRGLRNIKLLASNEVKSVFAPDLGELCVDRRSGDCLGNTVTVYYRGNEGNTEFKMEVERRAADAWQPDPTVAAFLAFAAADKGTTFGDVYHRFLEHLKMKRSQAARANPC